MEKRTPHYKLFVVHALVKAGKVRVSHSAMVGASIWQDVYRPSTKMGDVYLKLTVMDDVLIVSFKEL